MIDGPVGIDFPSFPGGAIWRRKVMKTMKFRAIIPERNATIYFDLNDLAKLGDLEDILRLREKFSTREILVPWLLQGNVPNLYTGKKDSAKWGKLTLHEQTVWLNSGKIKDEWSGKEIYGRDIVVPAPNEWDEPPYTVEFNEGCFTLNRPHTIVKTFWEIGFQLLIIGNVTENPELLGKK